MQQRWRSMLWFPIQYMLLYWSSNKSAGVTLLRMATHFWHVFRFIKKLWRRRKGIRGVALHLCARFQLFHYCTIGLLCFIEILYKGTRTGDRYVAENNAHFSFSLWEPITMGCLVETKYKDVWSCFTSMASYCSEIRKGNNIGTPRYGLSVMRSCTHWTATVADMINETCVDMHSMQNKLLGQGAVRMLLKDAALFKLTRQRTRRM